jgi:hypothetical protein
MVRTRRRPDAGVLTAVAVSAVVVPLSLRLPLVVVGLVLLLLVVFGAVRLGGMATATVLMVVLAAAPLPAALPIGLPVGGGTIFLADLVAGALLVGGLLSGSPQAARAVTVFLLVCGAGLLSGLAHGLQAAAAVRDVRGIAHGLAVLLGCLVLLDRNPRRAVGLGSTVVSAIVIWSGIASGVGLAIGGEWLNGRVLDAALYGGAFTGSFGATRLLLVSGPLCAATAAFCALVLAWRPVDRARRTWLLLILATSLLVLLLTYSRNNLVTVVAALALAVVLAERRLLAVRRLVGALGTVALPVVSLFAVAAAVSAPLRQELGTVGAAYSARVLNGLDPSVLALDASTLWRQRESSLALGYSLDNPLTGSGFGSPYRAVQPGEPFLGTDGTTYVHNTFLWLPVKLGWVVALILLAGLAVGLVRQWRSAQAGSVVRMAIGTLLALVPAMAVSPLPFSSASAVVLGMLGGLCLHPSGGSVRARSEAPGSDIVVPTLASRVDQSTGRRSLAIIVRSPTSRGRGRP